MSQTCLDNIYIPWPWPRMIAIIATEWWNYPHENNIYISAVSHDLEYPHKFVTKTDSWNRFSALLQSLIDSSTAKSAVFYLHSTTWKLCRHEQKKTNMRKKPCSQLRRLELVNIRIKHNNKTMTKIRTKTKTKRKTITKTIIKTDVMEIWGDLRPTQEPCTW